MTLADGSEVSAECFVFACGPWLGQMFPGLLGNVIRATRQEVFYFGTPIADDRFSDNRFPAWVDMGAQMFYGIPGNQWRGFKIADDTRGPDFDPTSGERLPTAESMKSVREYLAFRFPALAGAPLLESRVCQYEQTPDGDFVIDRHPSAANVWIAGGGSGHGFKHGPAVGELVSRLVLGEESRPAQFSLERFTA